MSLLNAVLDRITVKNGELYIVQRAIDSGMEHDFVLAVKHRLTSDYARMSLYIPSSHFHEESFPGMISTRGIHNAGKGVHSLPIKGTTSEIQEMSVLRMSRGEPLQWSEDIPEKGLFLLW